MAGDKEHFVSRSEVKSEPGADLKQWPAPTGAPVQIEAQIYELDPALGKITTAMALKEVAAGNANLIAMPLLVAHDGHWATFESVLNLNVPTTYDPPLIPKSLVGKVTGGSGLGGKSPVIASVPSVLPPFPRGFESREVGLKIKFRPQVREDGSITVDCELNRSGLNGFVDHGLPVTMTKSKSFGGGVKTITLLENHQLVPEIQNQTEPFSFSGKGAGSKVVDTVPAGGKATMEGFAATISRPDLPPLFINLTATKITEPPAVERAAREDAQIYLTVRVVEFSWEKGTPLSVPSRVYFTDPQFQMEIRRINVIKGVDIMSAPSVVTRNSQQASIEVVREFIYPTAYDPPEVPVGSAGAKTGSYPVTPATPTSFATVPIGVQLDVLPEIVSGDYIELKLKSGLTEFSQFLNFGESIAARGKNGIGSEVSVVLTENRIESPVFQKRGMATSVRVPNGGTVCVGGMLTDEVQFVEDKFPLLGDLPFIGGAWTSLEERKLKKSGYFFIRAQLIDPAGNPIE